MAHSSSMSYSINLRVQYSDTDKMQVVYHGNYIRYFHAVRTEYFRAAGYPYSDMEKEDFQMPVLGVTADFKSPAVYDERLSISCKVSKLAPASMEFEYEIRNAETGQLHVSGSSRHGFTNRDLRPVPLKKHCPEIYSFMAELYQQDKTE